jgi:hypothetical protein
MLVLAMQFSRDAKRSAPKSTTWSRVTPSKRNRGQRLLELPTRETEIYDRAGAVEAE